MFPIRKQKYNKKRFPIGIILIIFLLNLYFGSKMNIYASSIPFEGEGIAFDSEGNLWMVTHDKAAVTGIRSLWITKYPYIYSGLFGSTLSGQYVSNFTRTLWFPAIGLLYLLIVQPSVV